jgi:hypothetical protein
MNGSYSIGLENRVLVDNSARYVRKSTKRKTIAKLGNEVWISMGQVAISEGTFKGIKVIGMDSLGENLGKDMDCWVVGRTMMDRGREIRVLKQRWT